MEEILQQDKKKIIEYLVHDVFMREHSRLLSDFLIKYTDQIRESALMEMSVGIPVKYPQIIFDLRKPTGELIQNLIAVDVLFKEQMHVKPTDTIRS